MNRVFVWNEQVASPVGPFDLEVFMQLVDAGVIRADTLVATDGENTWALAAEHPATAPCLQPLSRVNRFTEVVNPEPVGGPREHAQRVKAQAPRKVYHSAYDPDYELEILDLNPSGRRQFRDYVLLACALNGLVVGGALMMPITPISATFLLALFFGGNVSLSWIFGVVLR